MANAPENLPTFEYASKLKIGANGDMAIIAGTYKGRYSSRVEDFKGNTVGFAHPLMKGVLLPVYRDMNFSFTVEDSGALYVFEFAVRRPELQGAVPILWAELVGEPKRIQRRQFLRVSCFWDISIFHIESEAKVPMSAKWLPTKALDISLGGTRFKMTDAEADGLVFESGDKIFAKFELAGKTYFQMSRATRVVHNESAWEVGISFDSVPASVEKRLFEYIRQQEIMGRDKGDK